MSNELVELSGVMYAPDFTKKQAEQTGINLINKLFEEGNQTPVQFYSNIARLKAVIDSADRAFRDRLNLTQPDSYNGVLFTPKNGAESLNYDEDDIYVSKIEEAFKVEKVTKEFFERYKILIQRSCSPS